MRKRVELTGNLPPTRRAALIHKAQKNWQRRYAAPIQPEEAEESLRNLVGFGKALLWANDEIQPS